VEIGDFNSGRLETYRLAGMGPDRWFRDDPDIILLDSHMGPRVIGIFIGFIPIAIVGGLSGFRAQNGTSIERCFAFSWLVVGIFMGSGFPDLDW